MMTFYIQKVKKTSVWYQNSLQNMFWLLPIVMAQDEQLPEANHCIVVIVLNIRGSHF